MHTNREKWELFPPTPQQIDEFLERLPKGSAATSLTDDYRVLFESQCGTTDDSQDVEQYDGTLGVTQTFVAAHQPPVGQIQWNANLAQIYNNPGNVSDVRWCTGTLITDNLLLTAGHCFDQVDDPLGWRVPRVNGTNDLIPPAEIALNMHVDFNYQRDANGVLRQELRFGVQALVEYRLGGLDFAIVRLTGSPADTFGIGVSATGDATEGETVCIIGHPAGMPKRIEAGPISAYSGNQIRYNDIDTLGGNSGSAIWHPSSGTIVGVHTNGGCHDIGYNYGVRISRLLQESPTLRSTLDGVFTASGRIAFLRVHDAGTGWGPRTDFLDVEVVIKLDTEPVKAFGLQLRNDRHEAAQRGQLDLLRSAFSQSDPIQIDYVRNGLNTGRIIRAMLTK